MRASARRRSTPTSRSSGSRRRTGARTRERDRGPRRQPLAAIHRQQHRPLDAQQRQRIHVDALQPRAEVNLSAQDIPELGVGAGLDSVELGLRLRYEFAREFAPYVGVEQEWKVGQSADYARLAGEDPSVTNYVVGVRFWF